MTQEQSRHTDQAEKDKQAKIREQRHEAFAENVLTVLLSLIAIAVISFVVWSIIAD